MDIRRQEIKISYNDREAIWELKYAKHPRVISYSSDYKMLNDLSEEILRYYFDELDKSLKGRIEELENLSKNEVLIN